MRTSWRGRARSIGVAAYDRVASTLGTGVDARNVHVAYATANFFPLLGVRAERGRFFTADEDKTTGAEHVVVLGDALWRGMFRGDPAVIGTVVRVRDVPFTVIGVAPPGFTGVDLGRVDAWVPMSVQGPGTTADWTRSWNAEWLHIVARLKPGVGREEASRDVTAAHRRLYDGPGDVASERLSAVPIRFTDQGAESTRAVVSRWVFGVTVIVLLIACINVANLLLARAARRRAEVGVRLALGAARRRLVRLFLTESLLLGLLGGVASLLVAGALSAFLRTSMFPDVEWTSSPVGGRVLLAAMAVAIAVGLLVGLAPAAHAARGTLASAMKSNVRRGGRLDLGAVPIVLQGTLTAVLLIGAGLFVRSLQRAEHVPLGFDAGSLLVAEADWAPAPDAATPVDFGARRARRNDVYRRAHDRVLRIPGVERAALAVGSPFGYDFTVPLFVPGWDSVPQLSTGAPRVSAVSSDYFATVGTRLLRGRAFRPDEGAGTEPVAIVNATMARVVWPGRDAIGNCLRVGADTAPCAQVVGIVEDAHRHRLLEPPAMQYYIPLGQESGFGGTVLMVRASVDSRALVTPVRRALQETDAMVSRVATAPLQDAIDPLLQPWRLGVSIFGLGGLLALLVAGLGLYSVLSYLVAQRTHELGVRIALGASARQIVGLVLRRSMGMALTGMALGFMAALYAGPLVERLLFETSPRDPGVFLATAALLAGSALLAGLIPALRARRVDPMRALNAE